MEPTRATQDEIQASKTHLRCAEVGRETSCFPTLWRAVATIAAPRWEGLHTDRIRRPKKVVKHAIHPWHNSRGTGVPPVPPSEARPDCVRQFTAEPAVPRQLLLNGYSA